MSGASFRKIDYSLRPSKNIERKMLAELFGKLVVFRPMPSYQYIGFGSVYFADYSLFHRLLGLRPMYSMEGDLEGVRRAKFNVPFSCVEVLHGKSTTSIPNIPFDGPTIVWLDYDYELSHAVLSDIQAVLFRQCKAGFTGVILLLSLDVESKRLGTPKSVAEDDVLLEDWPSDPVEQFERLVGESHLPVGIGSDALRGDELAETYRRVCDDLIRSTIVEFPGWEYQQLANFRYADGAKMATFGGVIFQEADAATVELAAFPSLPFVRTGSEFYAIDHPKLTFREIHALGRFVDSKECPADIPVSDEDFQKFRTFYRYFPSFVEAEL